MSGVEPVRGDVRVKALVWRNEPIPPSGEWLASTVCGLYSIPLGGVGFELRFRDKETFGIFGTLDDAKAAAQQDYATRILSAIEPGVEPADTRVNTEMREALAVLRPWLDDGEARLGLSAVQSMSLQQATAALVLLDGAAELLAASHSATGGVTEEDVEAALTEWRDSTDLSPRDVMRHMLESFAARHRSGEGEAAEWVLVPREPTEVMLMAGASALPDLSSQRMFKTTRSSYAAMIAAAPAHPAPEPEPAAGKGEVEALREALEKCRDIANGRDSLDGFPRANSERQRRLASIYEVAHVALAAKRTSPEPEEKL